MFVKMCEGQTFRAFVNERLAVAAGEIRLLFERTTVECEEELRLSDEKNKRKQRLLDKILSPRVVLVRARVPTKPTTSPGLNQEIRQTPRIKEEPREQRIKQEEETLPVCLPESSAVSVKGEEPSPLRQKQTERGNISSQPHFRSETEGHTEHSSGTDDDDEDWEPPFSRSDAQMQTEADGDHLNQVRSRGRSAKVSAQNKSAPETSAVVKCSTCQKTFTQSGTLNRHRRTHTGEKPHGCLICNKTFTQKTNLDAHRRTHTGEKPHGCLICNKTFTLKTNLAAHRRTHTGEKPHGCLICNKTFTLKCHLAAHRRTHTGERPYCCPACQKTFTQGNHLKNTHEHSQCLKYISTSDT